MFADDHLNICEKVPVPQTVPAQPMLTKVDTSLVCRRSVQELDVP